MFIKTDKKTLQEIVISSEEMVRVLEEDLRPSDDVDEVLTDIVTGAYKHNNRSAIYTYKA